MEDLPGHHLGWVRWLTDSTHPACGRVLFRGTHGAAFVDSTRLMAVDRPQRLGTNRARLSHRPRSEPILSHTEWFERRFAKVNSTHIRQLIHCVSNFQG